MATRNPNIQKMLDKMAEKFSIPADFIESSDHPYSCKCDKCLMWWTLMGRNPETDRYGPFTDEEIEAARKAGGE